MTEQSSRLTPAVRDQAFRWIADDPDPATRTELQTVLAQAMSGDAAAVADLAERMEGPLTFGTAGLRGPVRAGPNGMNTAVVVRTTAGVASWLRGRGEAGGTVVVGRDARHGSERFAAAAAEVLTAAGFAVTVLPAPLPTPVLAFAVGHLGAVAGIQITASHNPPADNGYKLYDGSGAQIVPPSDQEVEAAIAGAPAAVSVPRAPGTTTAGGDLLEAYLSRCAVLPRGTSRTVRVAATAMHGVGADVLERALAAAGFTDVHLVAEQARPDPDFPTVSFPNPEEPGATDLLLALAAEVDADLAIALDPDADRCALGARESDGTWRMLRGDETGVLLGDHVLSTVNGADALVATTIVSSSMLADIAETYGARYAETLTGFKWLARAGDGLVYAYEEALGVCVNPDFVRDKDGIAASVLACDLAATTKSAGRTLFDALDHLAVRHGVYLTDQISVRIPDLRARAELMARVRAEPPSTLAGTPVTAEDLLPDADVLRLRGDGVRVVLRPSGTEPKLKVYLELTAEVATEDDLPAARRTATDRLATLREEISSLLGPVNGSPAS
ncbi:phospho-sugar mutase [Prauserella cavernicola]|uniref:Phospho-sugar mutase n=1 Tax=Prauserella cavernicola TaxID=2800127 RepID=A0A934R0D8_9PSEU|nr:phospho-sugar mutase [Prauserella cavernicola]MBK1788809.1 phospho-sugar mutase [Prauserella cavernicola]